MVWITSVVRWNLHPVVFGVNIWKRIQMGCLYHMEGAGFKNHIHRRGVTSEKSPCRSHSEGHLVNRDSGVILCYSLPRNEWTCEFQHENGVLKIAFSTQGVFWATKVFRLANPLAQAASFDQTRPQSSWCSGTRIVRAHQTCFRLPSERRQLTH